jgi:hypothetical protein
MAAAVEARSLKVAVEFCIVEKVNFIPVVIFKSTRKIRTGYI